MPVAAIALAAAVAASQPNLAKILIKPAAVGPGYVLVQRTDGKGTAQRTLDLCGTNGYPSEKLRVDRLQVDYGKLGGNLLLSNEVVRYKPGGAAKAMREVAAHARTCPQRPLAFEGQPPLKYTFTRIFDSKLVRGALAFRIDVSGKIQGKHVSAIRYAIYQRVGDVLSGVYSYTAKGVPGSVQQAFVLHAAEASAKALRSTANGGGVPA